MEPEQIVEACLKETNVLNHITHHIADAAGGAYNWTTDSVIKRIEVMGLDTKIREKFKALMLEIIEDVK